MEEKKKSKICTKYDLPFIFFEEENMYFNANQQMLNNLERQKENINNLIAQYSQPVAPVQNIINTNSEFEARMIGENDDVSNIAVVHKTLFVNEAKKKIYIKEIDGTISKEYDIIVPLDEKDKKIIELENRLKEMEEKFNVQYAEPIKSDDVKQEPNATSDKSVEPTAKAVSKSVSKTSK